MQSYLEQLVEKETQLLEPIEKLDKFCESDTYKGLFSLNCEDVGLQLMLMRQYYLVLSCRIERHAHP